MSLIGKPEPDFTLPAVVKGEISSINTADLRGKWAVLFFYPLDFTFVCPTEILAFSKAASAFAARDCAVVGISVDSQFSHLAWVNTKPEDGGLGPIEIPLMADLNKEMCAAYDVLNVDAGVAFRGVYLLDPAGVVQSAIVNNLPVGRNASEVLRTLTAFQFVTSNEGQVCPAGWEEGDDSMTASPSGVAEYLASH